MDTAMNPQAGDWTADFSGSTTMAGPLPLECDLNVTRATLLRKPNRGDYSVAVYFTVNDGTRHKLCDLRCDPGAAAADVDLFRVFEHGDVVTFAVPGLACGESVRLEGHFGVSVAKTSLADRLTGVEHRLALHVTSTALELSRQVELVSKQQQDTIIRLEARLARAAAEKRALKGEVAQLRRNQIELEDWINKLEEERG